MESKLARLYIPDPKTETDAIRWRLNLIGLCELERDAGMAGKLEKAISKTIKHKLRAEDIQYWVGIANSDICEIDEVDYAVLFLANKLFESSEITEKQVFEMYPSIKDLKDTKKIIKGKTYKVSARKIIDEMKDKLEFTRISLRKFKLPIIRAKLALLELMAIIIPDQCIPKLLGLTLSYLSCSCVQNWLETLRYQRLFGNDEEKKNARYYLNRFYRAVEGDANLKKTRIYRYWFYDRFYQGMSKNISEYRKALASKDKKRQGVRLKILNILPIPEKLRGFIPGPRMKPKFLALEIMKELGYIDDTKAFLNFQPTISRLKKKHQLDYFIGPVGLTPLLKKYLDHPKKSPELVFKNDIFTVLETLDK